MTYGDKYQLEDDLKDCIYELGQLRNSAIFMEHCPEACHKAREAELFFKGVLLEVNELETDDYDQI